MVLVTHHYSNSVWSLDYFRCQVFRDSMKINKLLQIIKNKYLEILNTYPTESYQILPVWHNRKPKSNFMFHQKLLDILIPA